MKWCLLLSSIFIWWFAKDLEKKYLYLKNSIKNCLNFLLFHIMLTREEQLRVKIKKYFLIADAQIVKYSKIEKKNPGKWGSPCGLACRALSSGRRTRVQNSPIETPPCTPMAASACQICPGCNMLIQIIPLGVPKERSHALRADQICDGMFPDHPEGWVPDRRQKPIALL